MAGRNRQSWGQRGALVALGFLVLAVGFCLFDSDGMDGHASFDLCLGMLVASLTIVFAARLPLIGSIAGVLLAPALEFSPHVPAPPPKPAVLS
jgi:hypothetical protein